MTVHLAPQCAGKRVHVNFADPMSSTSYYSCEKLMGGVDVVSVHHECPEMQGFNPVIKASEGYLPFLIGGVPMGISTTACQGRELFENFADTKSDTGYYFCMHLLGGSAIVPVHKECPKGQVFNPSTKDCAAPSKRFARSASNPHDCPEGTKWEVDTQSCMTVHLAPQCAGKKVHVNFADPMSPTSYYSCEKLMGGVDVVPVHHECPEMQGFNPVIKACEGYLPFLIGGVPMGISTTACQGRELFENFADTK